MSRNKAESRLREQSIGNECGKILIPVQRGEELIDG